MPKDIGQELYFDKPVSHIRDISKQCDEIDKRLTKLWEARQVKHDPPLPIAPAHIAAVLNISKEDMSGWVTSQAKIKILDKDIAGGYKDSGKGVTSVRADADGALADQELVANYQRRSKLLTQWLLKAETTMLDTAQHPSYKGGQTGAIKGLEMCYGYKTTEQLEVVSKGDDLAQNLAIWRERERKKAAKIK
jgi:hypothetical protein